MRKRARRTRRLTKLETLETRTLLAGDLMRMHNPLDGADVNADGAVTMTDALMTVQELRRAPGAGERGANHFPDVNNDGNVTLGDALQVVERLRRPRPGGDGSGGDRTSEQQPPTEVASIDGTGNNLENPEFGSNDQPFVRLTTAEYEDGISAPAGSDRASAREVSNLLFEQSEDIFNDRGLTALVWQWGQFLDHDITLTHTTDEEFAIEVSQGDIYFDPFGTGTETIGFTRSASDPDSGDSIDNPLQQVNSITAFIDGSMIYGSDAETAASLREGTGGRLATSEGDLLPVDPLSGFFSAGDIRANEQPGLTAMHTLFVREHNHHAERIAAENPDWTDEEVFQAARQIVIGEIQAITYNEFLPALLGRELPDFRGYNPEVNPGISNEFATAAYRFGHSMVSGNYDLVDNDGNLIQSLSLAEAFFDPSIIAENGIDSAIKGLIEQQSQEIDTQVVGEMRNFLFGPPGAGGLDLVALNIQRGRDHGLADYNQTRVELGLEAVESFAEISSDPDVQAQLEEAYGTVDNIDLWVGVLAEDHLPRSSMGELGTRIMVDQFMRLRDGDRFYYENVFAGRQLDRIDHTTLAQVIQRNTDLTDLGRNVFVERDGDRDGRPRHDDRIALNDNELDPRPPRREDGDLDENEAPADEAPPTENDPTGQQDDGGRQRPDDGRPPRRGDDDRGPRDPLPGGEIDPEAADELFAELR